MAEGLSGTCLQASRSASGRVPCPSEFDNMHIVTHGNSICRGRRFRRRSTSRRAGRAAEAAARQDQGAGREYIRQGSISCWTATRTTSLDRRRCSKPPQVVGGESARRCVLALPAHHAVAVSSDPQLLDHRAHRSREVDARRPPAEATGALSDREKVDQFLDRWTWSGSAASHQGAGVRLAYKRTTRDVRVEPDRHAQPRGLPLRGVAVARRCEGRCWSSTPRRGGGADARQRLPGARRQPGDHPILNKIDLPVARPDEVKAEIEEIIGLDASDRSRSAKTGRARTRSSSGGEAHPAAGGDPDAPLQA